MTRAWVAEVPRGQGFIAHVEFDDERPFSVLPGPNRVPIEEALGWARAHSDRVSVRLGDTHYSAGRHAIRSLPAWTGVDPEPRPADREGRRRRFRAEARTGWYRDDRPDVARRLAEWVAAQNEVLESSYELRERGFSVGFLLESASLAAAQEDCFELIGSAWASSRIEARPGDDYDADSLVVTPVRDG